MKFIKLRSIKSADGSRPARGAWIEIWRVRIMVDGERSRPARGAWIEMCDLSGCPLAASVAPRKGRVD